MFALSKIPQGKTLENGKLIDTPQYVAMIQYQQEINETTRTPLSVGKERPRKKG